VKSATQEQPQVVTGQLRVAPFLPLWVLSLLGILFMLCLLTGGFGYSQVFVPYGNTKSAATAAVIQGETLSAQQAGQATAGAASTGTAIGETAIAIGDDDGDGLSNQKEAEVGTLPGDPDTDDDGLMDGQEVNQFSTDPKNQDSDSDGLKDGEEINTYHTQPKVEDTDGDGIKDGDEARNGTDPLATPMPTALPPTDTPPPTATAIVNVFNGEWRGTAITQPVHVSYAIAQLIVSNVNPQSNLATFHVCRCNSANCDARVEISPPQANAGIDGLKLVTTEPFYVSDTRFWILRAIRSDKQLIVTVEEYDSQTKNLLTVPDNLTLRRPTNAEKTTAFSCSNPVFIPQTKIFLNPNIFLLPAVPTATP